MGKRSRRTHDARAARDEAGGADGPARRRLPALRVLVAAAAAVAVVAVAGAFTLANRANAGEYSCLSLLQAPADASAVDGFETDSLGRKHVREGAKVSYGFCPPTSGDHLSEAGEGPIEPGFYGPDAEAGPTGWIHNLEHGYVVALYRCADGRCPSEADLEVLRSFAANGGPGSTARCEGRPKVVVARFDEMATGFALLAWDRALLVDAIAADTAASFADSWIDATAPEAGEC
jgi:hypothetical protein